MRSGQCEQMFEDPLFTPGAHGLMVNGGVGAGGPQSAQHQSGGGQVTSHLVQ
jgi:hypothetical protein